MNVDLQVSKSLKLLNKKDINIKEILKEFKKDEKEYKKIKKIFKGVVKNKKIINSIMENFYDDWEIKNKEKFMIIIYRVFFLSERIEEYHNKYRNIININSDKIKNFINSQNNQIDKIDQVEEQDHNNLMCCRINFQKKPNRSLKILSDNIDVRKDDLIDGLYYIQKKPKNFDRSLLNEVFYLRNSFDLLIQSKSSCMPAYILKLITQGNIKLSKNFDIIDTCSAPGNKTLQLSEYFGSSKIYAFEKNPRRFELLKNAVNTCNFNSNIIPSNKDFLMLDPNDTIYSKVEIFLADPSCSGSGTINNVGQYSEQLNNECSLHTSRSLIEKENLIRLNDFAKLQLKIINHCLKFPKVKYISYSTCSIFETENESVCQKILEGVNSRKVKTVDIFQLGKGFERYHKGISPNTAGTLRVCRKCHKEEGFYVAIFEKI